MNKLINIGQLDSKADWSIWKYKISILLRGFPNAFEVVEGKLLKPKDMTGNETKDEVAEYNKAVEKFQKADSTALLVLTNNMTESTVQKVMRLSSAFDVWKELHNLFDGVSEDKVYELCIQFFSFKKCSSDDLSTHISKLKNLWNNLKLEMAKDPQNNVELPDLFLICKILGTLPDEYFSFKSSWMLMSKDQRTVDNLTNQLCTYEKALSNQKAEHAPPEVLVSESSSSRKKKWVCHYCKKPGHFVKRCQKWKADGKPPKPSSSDQPKHTNSTNITLVTICNTDVSNRDDNWYVDNGATCHVTHDRKLFKKYMRRLQHHTKLQQQVVIRWMLWAKASLRLKP